MSEWLELSSGLELADFQWQLEEAGMEISYPCTEMKLTEAEVQLSFNPASFHQGY